ncbi:hypothetical protein AVEN_135539-1 [Araneus ventricosus]|uniref:Uncharacterized protein n=1 Tax=Araneus ventricosus TaxID=182803 RepID=A0A4Y2LL73_ARAVE|nr:hypothetical protein AVEN_135539-1 [Araneus ventricosus]
MSRYESGKTTTVLKGNENRLIELRPFSFQNLTATKPASGAADVIGVGLLYSVTLLRVKLKVPYFAVSFFPSPAASIVPFPAVSFAAYPA